MKKIVNIALIAAVMTGAAVTAQAATKEVHLYGASAQRDFWKDFGVTYLTNLGCSNVAKATNGSNYIALTGTNCTNSSGDNIYITYSSVSSIEGLLAVKGEAPNNPLLNDTCGGDNNMREVADWTTCNYTTGVCGAMKCADITAGTSDVEGSSFTQESHGALQGHLGGAMTDLTLSPITFDGMYENRKPTIVPFAFYVNNGIGSAAPVGDLANLTRTQAVNLFSGHIPYWGRLKGFELYNSNPVVLCLRHAGSGTHATLEKAVFRDDTKNPDDATALQLVKYQDTSAAPYKFFYESSSNMKLCVEDNGRTATGSPIPFNARAIGYMDADQVSTKAHQMKYQGSPAIDITLFNNRATNPGVTNPYINKGSYDFWSAQNVYFKTADNAALGNLISEMMDFAETAIPTTKTGIWSTGAALKVVKPTDESFVQRLNMP
jgi:hypothetical protein